MHSRTTTVRTALALGLTAALALTVHAARTPARAIDGLAPGKVELKSAGALAFGPDGVLFVGDSVGGSVAALDTGDRTPAKAHAVDVQGIDAKIAALVGVAPADIMINDVAVNPISRNVYVSASRGRVGHADAVGARQHQARVGGALGRAGGQCVRAPESAHADHY